MIQRLVVCCDGTWNSPDQPSGSDGAPTNVTKLALGVAPRDGDGGTQRVHYDPPQLREFLASGGKVTEVRDVP
jgi:uncharacterized protein (DUF2235 family)